MRLSGDIRSINRDLEKRARTLAGWKGYVTNLPNPDPETVISAYHRLYNIEKSFRMSKSDLRARPIYHHLRQSIEAHLTIVTAALAMARWLETATGWSIRRLITTAQRANSGQDGSWAKPQHAQSRPPPSRPRRT